MLAHVVAGRNSEPQVLQDAIHRSSTSNTFRSPKSPNNGRNSTPSVSPLSNASKTDNSRTIDSVVASRSTTDGAKLHELHYQEKEVQLPTTRPRRDTSSSLSDMGGNFEEQEQDLSGSDTAVTPEAEENDSEAETERIEPTPQKNKHNGKPVSYSSYLSTEEDMLPHDETVRTTQSREVSRRPDSLAGRKRKRGIAHTETLPEASDDSDSDGALTKKQAASRAGDDIDMASSSRMNDEEVGEMAIAHVRQVGKSHKKGKAKAVGKSHKKKVPIVEQAEEPHDVEEQVEEVEDESGDALSPEDVAKQEEATSLFSRVAEQFSALRSALQIDKIEDAEAELIQLQQPHPVHSEYFKQLQAVTERRDTRIMHEGRLHEYRKQALRNTTLASRSQLLSQYLQDAREIRERNMYELGKQWYDIQKERRQSDETERYVLQFPTLRKDQIKQQAKYNTEVSILSGIAKYVGFPAAPDITPSKANDVEADLRAMKVVRRLPQQAYQPPNYNAAVVTPTLPQTERNAHKDFLEQTPWANPHHPVHQSRTSSAFGHHGLGPHPTPPLGFVQRSSSTLDTPQLGFERFSGAEQQAGRFHDTTGTPNDQPSSALAAPPTADRIRLLPYEQGDTSPTALAKRAGGGGAGKRDFSGLSSTSTIEAPPEVAYMNSPRPVDQVPMQQMYATSSMHAQHSQ